MNSVAFGQYYPSNSLFHRLDPRFKVIFSILYIVCTFLAKSVLSFAALTISAIVLILISKIPLNVILRSLKPLLFIIAFTFAINIFWSSGNTLLTPENWKVHIYLEGIWNAVFMFFRIFTLIIGTSIFLTYTTTPMQLTDALEGLLSPLKVLHIPVHVFAMMMSITLRFIPTLSEETERIMNAQKARGTNFSEGSIFKRAKALVPILIPLLVSAINRALELASAMECRCYHGGDGRTKLHPLKCSWKDFAFLLLILLFGFLILNFNGKYFMEGITLPYPFDYIMG